MIESANIESNRIEDINSNLAQIELVMSDSIPLMPKTSTLYGLNSMLSCLV
jgi:hypothetical protein